MEMERYHSYLQSWIYLFVTLHGGCILAHVKALPDRETGLLLESWSVLSPHLGSIHIGWRLCVGLCQHRHHTQQYLLNALDWRPSLTAGLVSQRIIARGMEDADANFAIWVNVGVEQL